MQPLRPISFVQAAAAAASLMQRLDLQDAVESSSDASGIQGGQISSQQAVPEFNSQQALPQHLQAQHAVGEQGQSQQPLLQHQLQHDLPQRVPPEQITGQQALPQQVLPEQMLGQQGLPQHALPQQVLPEHMLRQPGSTQQALPQQVLPEQMLGQQALPQQALVLRDQVLQAPIESAAEALDSTAMSLSQALREIVHERELALDMRPFLQHVMEDACQPGVPTQQTLAWQLAGQQLSAAPIPAACPILCKVLERG